MGEAGDGAEAVAAATVLRPSAVVLDLNLPGSDGLAVACMLRHTPDPPRVLLTSGEVDAPPDDLIARSGAAGFVAKTELAVTDLVPYATLPAPGPAPPARRREHLLADQQQTGSAP